jgi:hypothetical protein
MQGHYGERRRKCKKQGKRERRKMDMDGICTKCGCDMKVTGSKNVIENDTTPDKETRQANRRRGEPGTREEPQAIFSVFRQ